jgi:hypothetical protein
MLAKDPEITRVKFHSICQSIFNLNSNDNAENPSLAGSESSSPPEPDSSSLAGPKSLYEYTDSFSDSAPPRIDEISAFENDD